MSITNEYLECDCSSIEHTVKITAEVDLEFPKHSNVTVQIQLSQYHPWYARIWNAVKYVFGYECKYGHWDVTMLNIEEVNKLHMLLHNFNKDVAEAINKKNE